MPQVPGTPLSLFPSPTTTRRNRAIFSTPNIIVRLLGPRGKRSRRHPPGRRATTKLKGQPIHRNVVPPHLYHKRRPKWHKATGTVSPPTYCCCWKYVDRLYQTFGPEQRATWRKAIKRPHISAYDLWMSEALFCVLNRQAPPDVPSRSGGWSPKKAWQGSKYGRPEWCFYDHPPTMAHEAMIEKMAPPYDQYWRIYCSAWDKDTHFPTTSGHWHWAYYDTNQAFWNISTTYYALGRWKNYVIWGSGVFDGFAAIIHPLDAEPCIALYTSILPYDWLYSNRIPWPGAPYPPPPYPNK